jgi:hypothetical protein
VCSGFDGCDEIRVWENSLRESRAPFLFLALAAFSRSRTSVRGRKEMATENPSGAGGLADLQHIRSPMISSIHIVPNRVVAVSGGSSYASYVRDQFITADM